MTIHTTLVCLTVLSLIAGVFLVRKTRPAHWTKQLQAFLVPPLFVLCAAQAALHILSSDHYLWNEIRLARTFGLYAGVPLYPGRDATGPILGTLHTPLSHILYWPATFANNAVSAVRIGVSLSVLLLLLALVYAHCRFIANPNAAHDTSRTPLLNLLFALEVFSLAVLNTTILSCVFVIHADPIALVCATFAAALLCMRNPSTRRLILSALFAILAVAAKQTFLPLPIALALFVFLIESRQTLFRYCLYLAGWALLTFATILTLFRPTKNLVFNLITLPSHRPPQPIMLRLPHLHSSLRAFCATLYHLIAHSIHSGTEGRAFVTFLLLLCLWTWLLLRHPSASTPRTLRQIISGHRWLIYILIALILFPLLFKASITVGGDENHLAIADFFLLLALTTGLLQYLQTLREPTRWPFPILIAFGLILFFSYRAKDDIKRGVLKRGPGHTAPSLTAEAAAFSCAHPGVAYFPSNPLSSVYSTHRFYTFDHAIDDREIAGLPSTPDAYTSGIPSNIQLIAVEPRLITVSEVSASLSHYLSANWTRDTDPALRDFLVYRRTSPGPSPPK